MYVCRFVEAACDRGSCLNIYDRKKRDSTVRRAIFRSQFVFVPLCLEFRRMLRISTIRIYVARAWSVQTALPQVQLHDLSVVGQHAAKRYVRERRNEPVDLAHLEKFRVLRLICVGVFLLCETLQKGCKKISYWYYNPFFFTIILLLQPIFIFTCIH